MHACPWLLASREHARFYEPWVEHCKLHLFCEFILLMSIRQKQISDIIHKAHACHAAAGHALTWHQSQGPPAGKPCRKEQAA